MVKQYEITISPKRRGFHLITSLIISRIGQLPDEGLLHLFLQHTTAAIIINENISEDVRADFETTTNRLVPENNASYHHKSEGTDDMPSHFKSSVFGQSLTITITGGKLNMGPWQGIYLCEFRNNGGKRKMIATIYY